MNKHEEMLKYLSECPYLSSFVHFNSVSETVTATGVIPAYSDDSIKQYIDGSKLKHYDFAFVKMQQNDDGTSNTNVNNMYDVQKFMEWIDEQDAICNYPDFGEDCIIESIENLQDMPNIASVDEQNLAEYMFQCRVVYTELSKGG